MLKAKVHHLFFWVIFSVLIVGSVFLSQSAPTAAFSGPSCNNGSVIVGPPDGAVVTGQVPLQVYVPMYLNPVNVIVETSDSVIGNATDLGGGIWELIWDSASTTSGGINIAAKVLYLGGGATVMDCVTDEIELIIESGNQQAELEIWVDREDWIGPTNVNVGFEVTAMMVGGTGGDNDVTNQAVITWITDIGTISNNGKFGIFSSGPLPGEGEVEVMVTFGGQSENESVEIIVLGQNETSTYPYNGDDPEFEGDEGDDNFLPGFGPSTRADGSPVAANAFGDEDLENCFQLVLGDGFEDLFDSGGRFSYEDLSKVRTCLAARRFVLPANLAPVDPQRVRDLRRSDKLKVLPLRQAQDNVGVDSGLILSGEANPDSDVLVYVFSEPLVLTTQSDETGNWTYVLEDPLEPGDHEVYVAVEDGGEFVRSDAFTFSLAQVASTEDNPNGLSLSLNNNADITIYVLGAAGTVVLGLVVFLILVHKKTQVFHPHAPKPEGHDGVPG